jgi:hypothetical protein
MMRGLRYILLSGSLGVLMLALAACSSIGSVTATPPKAAVATNQTTSTSAAPTVATPVSSPTRPATAATPSATATAGASPTTASASPARVATPGTPATPAGTRVAPEQAYKNLQQLPNSRQTWSFTGVALVGFLGTLSPVFDYADGNAKVTLTGGGATIEAYKVNGQIYTRAPILGVVPADPSNPLAPTADNLFALPDQILKILIPGGGQYTLAGPDTVNGRAATKYTSTIAVPDLGLLNPALSGQQGSAVTTVWVDDAQGYIAALDATITATTSGTTATPIKIHLDVTDVGQVPAITVPH